MMCAPGTSKSTTHVVETIEINFADVIFDSTFDILGCLGEWVGVYYPKKARVYFHSIVQKRKHKSLHSKRVKGR